MKHSVVEGAAVSRGLERDGVKNEVPELSAGQ